MQINIHNNTGSPNSGDYGGYNYYGGYGGGYSGGGYGGYYGGYGGYYGGYGGYSYYGGGYGYGGYYGGFYRYMGCQLARDSISSLAYKVTAPAAVSRKRSRARQQLAMCGQKLSPGHGVARCNLGQHG
jgi:hypothetical protein